MGYAGQCLRILDKRSKPDAAIYGGLSCIRLVGNTCEGLKMIDKVLIEAWG